MMTLHSLDDICLPQYWGLQARDPGAGSIGMRRACFPPWGWLLRARAGGTGELWGLLTRALTPR